MSVNANSNGELRSLNRVQPVDPAYVQSWSVALTGDASAGVADITLNMPDDHAFIPIYFGGRSAAGDLVAQLTIDPGIDVQGSALALDMTSEVIAAINGTSRVSFEPERVLFVPDPGTSTNIRLRWDNPGAATTVEAFGQCYLWPVNEVRSLSPRQLWYFLQH